ncbi:MAG: glycosyltransferase family 2 protein [Ignavibacteriae bacterium]|nr:glycosyltransferase family 2 protein [Ignavibacteriota bacterium]
MSLKFSIITPSYNQGRFIKDTIESVISQNYYDIEHIVIDGGSTDDTVEILKSYSHLKWISEQDKGAANAINKGVRIAKGDIITWINSDDYYEKNIFNDIARVFEENPEISFVYGNLIFVNETKKILHIDKTEEYVVENFIHKNADGLRQPCTFFRKSLFEKVGGLDESLKCVFDYDLFIKMLLITKPYYLNKNLAYYRDYGNTLTRRNIKTQGMEIIKVARKYGAKIYDKIILKSYIKKVLFTKIFYKN